MKTNIIKSTLGFSVFVFAFTVLGSSSASAATVKLGANKTDCIAQQVATGDITVLKDYGKKRVDSRNKYLDKSYSDDKIDSKYEKLDSSFEKAKKEVNKRTKKDVKIDKPKNHAGNLKSERGVIKQALASKASVINDSTDINAVATANCEIVWDLRIWSYVLPKLSNQYALDTLATKNAINKAYFEYAKENNKAGGIDNPTKLDARINALQTNLDQIVITSSAPVGTGNFNPEQKKSAEAFKTQLADMPAVKKEISSVGKKVKFAARTTAKDKKKSTKSKKTTSKNSNSTSNPNSSTESTSNKSTSSSSNKDTKKDVKKDSKKSSKPAYASAKLSTAEIKSLCQPYVGPKKAAANWAGNSRDSKNRDGYIKDMSPKDVAWRTRSCHEGAKKANADYNKNKITPKSCSPAGRKANVETVCNYGRTAAVKRLNEKAGPNNVTR